VGGDGGDEKGLEFDVTGDEGAGKWIAGGETGFSVEVAGGLEVVQGSFEGKFVVRAAIMLAL
jgi:hypothetical protein